MDHQESDIESSSVGVEAMEHEEVDLSLANIVDEKGLAPANGEEESIYRVPEGLRKVEQLESAFVPRLISIGPFYHSDKKYKAVEWYKTMYLKELFRECRDRAKLEFPRNKDGNLDNKGQAREGHERSYPTVRKSYEPAKHPKIEQDDFIKMVMLDGCFVVQLLRKFHKFQQTRAEKGDDPILDTRWMLRTFQRDMIILDNQLPYKVLKKVYRIMCPREDTPLETLVVEFFKPLFPEDILISDPKPRGGRGYDDMLDLFKTGFISKVSAKVDKNRWSPPRKDHVAGAVKDADHRRLLHRARSLRQAGIEIKRKEESELLEIEFDGRALLIPPLYVEDDSLTVLLNFLALEQWDHEPNPFFTNYFFFMDSMIHSKEDVELLHKARIIDHALGSNKAVSDVVNKVCRQIVNDPERCYLWDEIQKANAKCNVYYSNYWVKLWRNLRSKYFGSPWSFISLAAAIFLLMLTDVQTFYIIYPYYVPDAYFLKGRPRLQLQPEYNNTVL